MGKRQAKPTNAPIVFTSLTVRANVAFAPFQHIRVELSASVNKEQVKEAREQILEELHRVLHAGSELLKQNKPPPAEDSDETDYTPPDADKPDNQDDEINNPF